MANLVIVMGNPTYRFVGTNVPLVMATIEMRRHPAHPGRPHSQKDFLAEAYETGGKSLRNI
jgi:hypothetical protein